MLYDSRSITANEYDKEVTVEGWAQEVRNLGGISFLILRDRYGTVQVTAPKKRTAPDVMQTIASLARESVVRVTGTVKASPQVRAGYEIVPASIQVVGPAKAPLPMGVVDKVDVEPETRFNHRYMDLRRPEVRAVFELKSLTTRLIDEYLVDNGFVEVFTPKLVASGAEGGSTLFKVDYFGRPAFLAQSPQLYKQMLMATGLDRVFEIGPAFRAEPSDTARHVSEFISFDGEMAHIDSQADVMAMVEGCTRFVIAEVRERGSRELSVLGVDVSVPKAPYPVIPYERAIAMVREAGLRIELGDDLGTEGERLLGDLMLQDGHEMYWIIEYPEAAKPFYIMEKDGTPYSFSFDLDYRGQEISSGGQREHRYDRLVQRMQRLGLDPGSFEFYLNAFAYGMPAHGGWGLGVERMVQKMLGLSNVRETILFPRDRNRLVP
ncbi:MAG TPA: aspartate--tRNA(Asn) ligase [Methanomassiliicoccales archaeon]|nr:aspartate--tRNA(Asn) ligase [Methanomassiliicoccales archaeon]